MKHILILLAMTISFAGFGQMSKDAQCPFGHGPDASSSNATPGVKATADETTMDGRFKTNRDWWPNQLDLSVLRQHSEMSNPMGDEFDYKKEFQNLDYEALKKILLN